MNGSGGVSGGGEEKHLVSACEEAKCRGCGGGCGGGTCDTSGGGGAGALGPLGALAAGSGGGGAGAGLLPPSPLAATALVALLVLALYRLSACPGPVPPFTFDKGGLPAPSYLLLLPGNASSLPPPYPLHLLPSGDRDALIDVRPFVFREPGPSAERACGAAGGDAPLLLVLVHSAPNNALKRTAIRDTWASTAIHTTPQQQHGGAKARGLDTRMRVLFLLGSVDSPDLQATIDQENEIHGDIVQGSFRDSYRNMTYKHVMALKWTAYNCPGARYLLKTDDDVFVHTPALLRFLSRELSPWGARRLILCRPFPYAYVKRSWRSKWRVSPKEYPGRLYPRYCAGWAVLYSPDAVFLLYREAQRTPYFWIDDVHVTGTLAARANLSQTPLGTLALSEDQVDKLLGHTKPASAPRTPLPPYAHSFLFGAPDLQRERLYQLWDLVQRTEKES